MEYKLVIPGKLSGLNEYINAERTNRYKAAKLKRENEKTVTAAIWQQLRGVKIKAPVEMHYCWHEPDRRRDLDNITFGRKIIQDALVKEGVLKDDGWRYVVGFSDRFEVSKNDPKIEVIIREVE